MSDTKTPAPGHVGELAPPYAGPFGTNDLSLVIAEERAMRAALQKRVEELSLQCEAARRERDEALSGEHGEVQRRELAERERDEARAALNTEREQIQKLEARGRKVVEMLREDDDLTLGAAIADLDETLRGILPYAPNDQWSTRALEGEATGCYPCDTCNGYRAHGSPCFSCSATRKRAAQAEAAAAAMRDMLKRVLAAWKHEAQQGDGIAESHAPLYMEAMRLADGWSDAGKALLERVRRYEEALQAIQRTAGNDPDPRHAARAALEGRL